MSIWQHVSYRDYLLEKLGKEGSRTGLRKQLAKAIDVHTSLVSQVLTGRIDFSLEQAERVNLFFEHTDDESRYFLLLVLKDRAGSQRLKERFMKEVRSAQEARLNISRRLEVKDSVSQADRERFYSSYVYGAIHVLSAISKFQTIEALASALNLQRSQVKEAVEFMVNIGVLKEMEGRVTPGSRHIHLSNDSALILKHHMNWRFHSISSLQFLNQDDLHYSACMSISKDDAQKIKEMILDGLKSKMDVVAKSPEEVAYVLNFDFYRLATMG